MLRANENARYSDAELDAGMDRIWHVMRDCIAHGLSTPGQLPGGLNVKRRAKLWQQANDKSAAAKAVNAARCAASGQPVRDGRQRRKRGRRPCRHGADQWRGRHHSGSAALLRGRLQAERSGHRRAQLPATAAIGMLCKRNASIFGAEIGCQGEVGVACAMAAAGLVAALGGSNGRSRTRPKSASSTIWA
jgi:L-serine dehydratase